MLDKPKDAMGELLDLSILKFFGNLAAACEEEERRGGSHEDVMKRMRSLPKDKEFEQRIFDTHALKNQFGYVDEDISQKDQRQHELDQYRQLLFSSSNPDPANPPTPGSFDSLTPHIWSRIVSFLVPPKPKPLSGMTKREYSYLANHPDVDLKKMYTNMPDEGEPGTITRRDIRANDLAVLMRVSSPFNFHAARYLYKDVICDDLPGLICHLDFPPVHPQIESKNQLLRRIRTLRLEYGQKEDGTSYLDIMVEPLHYRNMGILNRAVDTIYQGLGEALRISRSLTMLQWSKTRFPALTHLAVCSVFGGHESLWDGVTYRDNGFVFCDNGRGDGTQPPVADLVLMCQQSAMLIFRASPLLHYCQRTAFGPFALPAAFDWDDSFPATHSKKYPGARNLKGLPNTAFPPAASIPLFTSHVRCIVNVSIRASPKYPTRWLLENSDRKEYTTNYLVHNFMCKVDDLHATILDAGFEGYAVDIDAYISSHRYTPGGLPRQWPADPKSILKAKKGAEGVILDKIRKRIVERDREAGLPDNEGISSWRPSTQSPECEACGWEFEDAA